MSSIYRQQLEKYLARLEIKAESVLDVGGAQLPVSKRVAKFDVGTYAILDLPEPHKVHESLTGHKPMMADINLELPDEMQETYDVVFCLEVMEYIWNPAQALKNLAALTNKGGTLYITFPHYYPPHEPIEHDTLRYTLSGAKRFLAMAGFDMEAMFSRPDHTGGLITTIERNMLRASKKASREQVASLGFIIKAKRV
jgi:SAM-dependent methyltransferase